MMIRFVLLLVLLGASTFAADIPIDRHALVTRHNPRITRVDPDAPLTVGNGNFAFGCDITGLQTFADYYQRNGIPVETLSRWCWVTDPNPNNYTLADASKDFTMPDGSVRPFPTKASSPAGDWLRKNPRLQPLGQISLEWDKADGTPFVPEDVEEPEQTLDLWTGIITSKYKLGGVPVVVTTVCDPELDFLNIHIESRLVETGKLRIRLAFPRGYDLNVKNTPPLDWTHPEKHNSEDATGEMASSFGIIQRKIQNTEYEVAVTASLDSYGAPSDEQLSSHVFRTEPVAAGEKKIDFGIWFFNERTIKEAATKFDSDKIKNRLLKVGQLQAFSADHWQNFWRTTAAVDFSGSTNPLAAKLEERMILSRYLMAVQMAGDVPPQETGLTCSTWYGKHHSEMIYWHAAHFALWGSDPLLARNLDWFKSQLPAARALAKERGLRGARWAKMTGPVMRESPGGNPLIVWNQPHMIYLSELLYRNSPTPATLAAYRDLVLETAECVASMVHWNADKKQYDLGPPLWIAQEIYDQATSQNPSYELAYWRWSLETAQQWRVRLGQSRDEHWDHIIAHLAPIPQKDGKYVALGSNPDTWDNLESRHDHPTMLAPLGILPGNDPDVDRATMERTLDAVLKTWDWETKIWGWDYPMIAMTATRLGRPDTALEVLMRDGPNNRYLPTGHCPQRSDEKQGRFAAPGTRKREIAVYLPANGAFLNAVALMVAGWDGCTMEFPGFPKDGTWKIRAEGLHRSP